MPTPEPGAYAYKDMVVGFIQSSSQGAWQAANTGSFVQAAATQDVALDLYDAGGRFANQIAAFRRFVEDKTTNVIVLSAVQEGGYDDVLREARAAGKVVVLEDRHIDADSSLYAAYVGPDHDLQGRNAAAAMCDLLKSSRRKNVAEISGPADDPVETDLAAGFRAQMGHCGIAIPKELSTATGPDTVDSEAAVSAWLARTRDIEGIFAHGDEQAIGAIAAIKAFGLRPGKDIQLVSVGATAAAFEYLISGELGADVENNPLLGPKVLDAALRALNRDTGWRSSGPSEDAVFYASMGPQLLREILATRKY